MKKMLLVTVGFATLGVAPAFAADLAARNYNYTKAPAYVAPLPSWAGFYLGVNGGGAWSHNCWNLTNAGGAAVSPALGEGCNNASGGVVGGQLGYRFQANNWVFGLEAQGDWASLKKSNTSQAIAGVTNQTKTDAVGLFTGQVGYAWGNVLGYVKGGAALTHDKYNGSVTATGAALDSATETRWGGTVGAGVEYGFAPNWSFGVEYDHLFMGKSNDTLTSAATTRTDSIKQDVDMATARVNYRFGGPAIARY